MTTYAELQGIVSRRIGDSANATFTEDVVKDFIQDALAEIGRIAPERFQEDIEPIADTLSYALRSDDFPDGTVPEIELYRVEVWDGSVTPPRALKWLQPMSSHPAGLAYSNAGWVLWGGTLELPNRAVDFIIPDTHLIRVWGYSPYPPVEEDDDVIPVSNELQQALVLYCRVQAMEALISDRVLFTQWQARSNNADVSPAGLMNEYQIVSEAWRKKSKAIFVIRETPG
jgi:hypothetical protein